MTYQFRKKHKCVQCAGSPVVARKLCKPCYYYFRHRNQLDQFSILKPEDVFEERIKKTKYCWIWQGSKNSYGYGIFLMPGEKPVRAHRYSYEYYIGPIPNGAVVMHSCDNPICVNPKHLSVGTRTDNNRDACRKKRNAYGERCGRSKLTEKQVIKIIADNRKNRVIAKEYKIDQSTVSRLKNRKRWNHLADQK